MPQLSQSGILLQVVLIKHLLLLFFIDAPSLDLAVCDLHFRVAAVTLVMALETLKRTRDEANDIADGSADEQDK